MRRKARGMEALARGRADVLATWLNGIAQTGRRLAEADPAAPVRQRDGVRGSAEPPTAPDQSTSRFCSG